MFKELEKALKESDWEYQVLRNNLYQKEAIYIVIGNQEVVLFKNEKEGILRDYISLIKEW